MDLTIEDMIRSDTAKAKGIDNTPTTQVTLRMQALLDNLVNPINKIIPLRITSGYRCKELNAAVGGVPTSQHTFGMAADTIPQGHNLIELMDTVIQSGLEFDQLILEKGVWVHMSYYAEHNRKQALIIHQDGRVEEYVSPEKRVV